jgi:predicted DNA-binding WGR domain protein
VGRPPATRVLYNKTIDPIRSSMDAAVEGICPMSDVLPDLELRLIDPDRNKFRVYGLTPCRTLFGEVCLRIQWGRLGHRKLRERSEIFPDESSLRRRRSELLELRRRHGYRAISPRSAQPRPPQAERAGGAAASAMQREIVEAHGLSLRERAAQQLVARWQDATEAILRYLEERQPEHLDLVDVSTLAAMYVEAAAS